jgi:hypothetical protein
MASMPKAVSPVSDAGRWCRMMMGRSAATERPETMANTMACSSTGAPSAAAPAAARAPTAKKMMRKDAVKASPIARATARTIQRTLSTL